MTQMSNPWLDITEGDYVGHMSSPAVNQRPVLSHLLRDVLESTRVMEVFQLPLDENREASVAAFRSDRNRRDLATMLPTTISLFSRTNFVDWTCG